MTCSRLIERPRHLSRNTVVLVNDGSVGSRGSYAYNVISKNTATWMEQTFTSAC